MSVSVRLPIPRQILNVIDPDEQYLSIGDVESIYKSSFTGVTRTLTRSVLLFEKRARDDGNGKAVVYARNVRRRIDARLIRVDT